MKTISALLLLGVLLTGAFAQRPRAQATLKDNLAAVDEAEANARDAELLHGVLDEVLDEGDALGV